MACRPPPPPRASRSLSEEVIAEAGWEASGLGGSRRRGQDARRPWGGQPVGRSVWGGTVVREGYGSWRTMRRRQKAPGDGHGGPCPVRRGARHGLPEAEQHRSGLARLHPCQQGGAAPAGQGAGLGGGGGRSRPRPPSHPQSPGSSPHR